MKYPLKSALCLTLLVAPASAETLLFLDNFDVADTDVFDAAPLDNRRSGTLADTVVVRAAVAQQWIRNNQVSMRGNSRLRFQNDTGWFNWASEPPASTILADGGLRVEFDWVPTNDTSTNWVSFNVGFPGSASGEPFPRVNHAQTDFGILFRNNGGTERFDNGVNLGPGDSFTATTVSRHVVIDYAFTSFADGTTVNLRALVDGTLVSTNTFNWDSNNGALYLEIETNQADSLIDNYKISTLPEIASTDLGVALSTNSFASGLPQGGLVALLTASTFGQPPQEATFELVPNPDGEEPNNNQYFVINGDRLEVGTHDFREEFEGSLFTVRVRATSTSTGATGEGLFTLELIKDDDADGLLDSWELLHTGNLTDLNGLATGPGPGAGTGDFDGDGATDLEEFNHSQGDYPDINPLEADTDGDGLTDGQETQGAGSRPPTNPTRPDTDGDGLSDLVETNTTVFVDDQNTGTNPIRVDSDGDGARDEFEIARSSNPSDINSRPALPSSISLVRIRDEADLDISVNKTYTHLISGGVPATVNGVSFNALTPTETPENFSWAISAGAKGNIGPRNFSDWEPGAGGVSGDGLLDLLGGFSYMTVGDPGGSQTYTISGLTVGETYELRLYTRVWDLEGSGRPIDFIITNGSTVDHPFGALLMDRPGLMLQSENPHAAYYISYTYVAESTELVINANVHGSAAVASGSHHLYALTNEALTQPSGELRITSITRDTTGNVIINFLGEPDRTYRVTKSPDLTTPFAPLTQPLSVLTNASGSGQAVIPASEASEAFEFYRIEQ